MATTLQMDLTLEEKEIFCGLPIDKQDPANKSLRAKQIRISKRLAKIYQYGDEMAPLDLRRAAAYQDKIIKYHLKENPQEPEDPEIFKVCNIPDTSLTTATSYKTASWFTSLRLTASRANRFVSQVGAKLFPDPVIKGLAYGGLSYGLELLIDLGVIAKHMIWPSPGEAKNPWTRLKNIVRKGDRPYRMFNAALWFGINLTCLCVTGGTSILLNLIGFSLDVVKESVEGFKDISRYDKLLNKTNHRLNQIKGELITCGSSDVSEHKITLQQEYRDLLTTQKALKQKITDVKKTRALIIGVTAIILTGMCMFWFGAPIIAGIGAGVVLASSCIFLGRRIRNALCAPPDKVVAPAMLSREDQVLLTNNETVRQPGHAPISMPPSNKNASNPGTGVVAPFSIADPGHHPAHYFHRSGSVSSSGMFKTGSSAPPPQSHMYLQTFRNPRNG